MLKKFHIENSMIQQTLQKCKNLRQLQQTHVQILVHGLIESSHILPKLVDLSSTFNSLSYATRIFQHSQNPNLVAFNTMIKCLIENRRLNEAFSSYSRMRVSGILPNNFTFTILLKACESAECLKWSSEIHAQIVKCGFGFNVFVQNTLLKVYSKCSAGLDVARQVFDEMLERDVVSWNSIIGAYLARGYTDDALYLFEAMPVRNVVSWNTVVSSLCKAGEMESARSVFDQMATTNTVTCNSMITGYLNRDNIAAARSIFDQVKEKDIVSWNAMISAYNQNRQFDEALHLFQSMLLDGRFPPDEATLVSIVSACSQLGSFEHGNWVYSYIKKNNVDLTITLGNALIDMFAKCGDTKKAEMVFNQMRGRDVITWTAMASGLAFNGQCKEALLLFEGMCSEGLEPDDVMFIVVLSACSHGGLVKEGQEVFDRMVKFFKINPRMEHYCCIVDLLARAGKLEEAMQFIESMPLEPTAVVWATLLRFSSTDGAIEMVKKLTQKIDTLDPGNSGFRVLVSNSSADKGRWEDVVEVRSRMRREGIAKVPGCSSIQVGGGVHEFLVKDSKHKRRKEIYETLDGMTQLIRSIV